MDDSTISCPTCRENPAETVRKSHHDEKTIRELVNRMNRIEGQVRGIKGMMERQLYCDEILHQIASAQSALHGVAKLLLEKHMKSCVAQQLRSGSDQVVDEVITTIFKLIR